MAKEAFQGEVQGTLTGSNPTTKKPNKQIGLGLITAPKKCLFLGSK